MELKDKDQDESDIQEAEGQEEHEGASDEMGDVDNNNKKYEAESVGQDPQGK